MSRPIWLGVLIAPLAAPFVFALVLMVRALPEVRANDAIGMVLFSLTMGVPISYMASILIGLPTILLLKSKRTLSVGTCLLAGAVTGSIIGVGSLILISAGVFTDGRALATATYWVGAGAGLGLSVAGAFCAIARLPAQSDSLNIDAERRAKHDHVSARVDN